MGYVFTAVIAQSIRQVWRVTSPSIWIDQGLWVFWIRLASRPEGISLSLGYFLAQAGKPPTFQWEWRLIKSGAVSPSILSHISTWAVFSFILLSSSALHFNFMFSCSISAALTLNLNTDASKKYSSCAACLPEVDPSLLVKLWCDMSKTHSLGRCTRNNIFMFNGQKRNKEAEKSVESGLFAD